jgi:hypothetical protein
VPHKQGQHRSQVGIGPAEFPDDPGLFAAFKFDQDMFFGREVEIEGAPHYARRSCDRGNVSSG